ncbi:hypothetical protein HanPSC8_Chr17g0777881 [Helianthus annuus]|nr:hypothetical protein HanPSC8_Chr17g0777881 [Helianthus annuus]
MKFIKGEDGYVLVKEPDIKFRWLTYFSNLFSGGKEVQQERDDNTQGRQRNNCYCRSIIMGEVRTTLKKMRRAKAVGPDNIPIEVWKCLGEDGV